MHILLTGATGFIGGALVPRLLAAGHTLTVYSRQYRANQTRLAYIDTIEKLDGLAPIDAVINWRVNHSQPNAGRKRIKSVFSRVASISQTNSLKH